MTARYPILYRTVQGIAILTVLLSILLPSVLLQVQLAMAVGMILLVGIPHGATDYLIFQNLSRPMWGSKEMTQFYFNYVLLMAAYAVVWWLMPAVALVLWAFPCTTLGSPIGIMCPSSTNGAPIPRTCCGEGSCC